MAVFVRFVRPFNYSPLGARWAIGYAAGRTVLVPEAHVRAAERVGAGVRVPRDQVDRTDPRTVTRTALLRRSA